MGIQDPSRSGGQRQESFEHGKAQTNAAWGGKVELEAMPCVPCRGDEPPLTEAEIATLLPAVPEWQMVVREGIPQLERTFRFSNFREALRFTLEVGELAEREGHHPVLITRWGRVTVTWWTHKIRGLHRNDFIMAAKTDALYKKHLSAAGAAESSLAGDEREGTSQAPSGP